MSDDQRDDEPLEDDSSSAEKLPAEPSEDDDSALGDTDQHSSADA